MKKLIFIFAMLPTIAFGQQPSEYNLRVTPAEIDLISKGLGTQPFNDVLPLINKLRSQVIEQQPKPVENKADEPKK